MRITVNQLRRIIKEEVSRALKEGMPGDAEIALRIALQNYGKSPSPSTWEPIKAAIQDYVDETGEEVEDVCNFVYDVTTQMGYDSEDQMDLEASIRGFMGSNSR